MTIKTNSQEQKNFAPGLTIMYLDTLLMAVGFFMLMPLLGVYFINHLGWSSALSGSIIAVGSIAQNGLRFVFGMIADRIGYKNAILFGVGIRVVGFLLYSTVQHPVGYGIAAFIAGMGGAFFHPASYAAYARLTDGEMKNKIYAVRETLSNVGFILGPVIGMLLLQFEFSFVCYVSASMFIFSFVLSCFFLPSMKGEGLNKVRFLRLFKDVFQDTPFLIFSIFVTGAWAVNVQLYLAVPVRAEAVLDHPNISAYLYMAGAAFMVLFQIPILQFLASKMKQAHIISLGVFILGSSMLFFGFSFNFWSMLFAVLMFTLGQMLFIPTMNQCVSRFAGDSSFATYFGFQGWSLAIGGFLGNTGGGYLYDLSGMHNGLYWLPWLALFVLGCVSALFFLKVKIS